MTRFVSILFCLLLAATTPAQEPTSGTWGLEQLLQQRAQVKNGRANFTEVRKIPAADMTTTSTGVLIYEAPDRLERQISKPSSERTVIQGDRITLDIGNAAGKSSRREFALNDIPGLRPFFTALRAFLAGDKETLQKKFRTSFEGSENNWRLKLTPREPGDRHVREITVTGSSVEMSTIEILETSGDSSRIALTPETATPAPDSPARNGG